ncbi:NYN domain-containing protein [Knoellia sp. LjRoot47]|uniref:NYN domain-containing protein n=1 Tax=Knoellia sp. LjRoot47 TaxID=3342330 RepID=UPI003ECE34BE
MTDAARVAVYVDFDNMVISRYDNVHGSGRWRDDKARNHTPSSKENGNGSATEVPVRLHAAHVDLGAVIDYASSFGTVALTRAYADWSVPANAAYRQDLVDRAVDLVQLFATSGTKNGADIRLAIDAVDDLYKHGDLTHVVIVGGDSDYIPLAQHCKRMGRFVVGIGVSGSTSRALRSACDAFSSYDDLPGLEDRAAARAVPPSPAAKAPEPAEKKAPTTKASTKAAAPAAKKTPAKKAAAKKASTPPGTKPDLPGSKLLRRAMQVGTARDDGWHDSSTVKNQILRLDSGFKEKTYGESSWRGFVEARSSVVETRTLDNGQMLLRLR